MICCSLGNERYASVDSYCQVTWLHRKQVVIAKGKKKIKPPRGKHIDILDIPPVDDRQL